MGIARTLEAIDLEIEQTHRWIDDLMDETDWQDRSKAFVGLRAVLHTLRDRLSFEEAVSLGGELPALLRGVFFDGWQPNERPRHFSTRREFLRGVAARLSSAGQREDPEVLTRAVFRVLARNLPGTRAA